ncbi:MAG TPA: exopolyphosphatase [Candidatus Gastranaerophilales bacterium]|nr:exopolyphosphatase [Candidatus Gastranaerophilales bacterium]
MKYRLVTRSDFDGLVCASLLKELDMIDDILFVHPKDMQDGKIEISDKDITTNLPYVEGVHIALDHHLSETVRIEKRPSNHIIDPTAPSAARVLFNYLGGEVKFTKRWDEILEAVDKADSADFSREEILKPNDWALLNFLMDPRTGLGRFRNFKISNYQLMMDLIEKCKTHTIKEILNLPDVKERVELYFGLENKFKDQLIKCSKVYDNIIMLDLRGEEIIYPGNRFMLYAIYPECNISMHVLWGLKKQNTVFAVGKSILNRTSNVNIGKLMLEYGGGGHENAGTCQIINDKAEHVKDELIQKINSEE